MLIASPLRILDLQGSCPTHWNKSVHGGFRAGSWDEPVGYMVATSSVPCVCTFRSLLIDLVWLGIGTHGRVRSKGRWIVPSLFLHPSRGSYPSGLPSPCVSMRPTGRVRRSLHHATPSVDLPFRPCSTRLGCILPSIPSLRVSGVGVIEGEEGIGPRVCPGLDRGLFRSSLPFTNPWNRGREGRRHAPHRTVDARTRTAPPCVLLRSHVGTPQVGPAREPGRNRLTDEETSTRTAREPEPLRPCPR